MVTMKKTTSTLLGVAIFAVFLAGCISGSRDTNSILGEVASSVEPPPIEVAVDQESGTETGEDLPDNDWEIDSPGNHGMDGILLNELHNALVETEIYSVVTVKDGYLVDEYYKDGYDENSIFRMHSCSKSFTGALIGIAIDKELIKSADTSIAEYFPQLAGTDKEEIAIRHLLSATPGIAWYEWGGNSSSWRPFVGSDNWVDYVLSQPMAYTPGTVFNYTTGGSHLLAAILQESTGKSAYDFGTEHLFAPMGMDSVRWSADPQGITDGGNGISMSSRDAAKFGQLYLDGGKWRELQIIPELWVEESVTTQISRSGNSGSYGYQWWLRPFGDENYDTYYAMGHAGQFVFVVPELDLVTVITSRYPQDTYAPWPYFEDYILAACRPTL